MGGYEFKKFLEYLFKRVGYKILKFPEKTGDFGADLVVKDNKGNKIAIQAKRYKNNVSPSAVQEVTGALGYYNCQKGMVVTNSHLIISAKKLARSNNIEIWELEDLVKKLNRLKEKQAPLN